MAQIITDSGPAILNLILEFNKGKKLFTHLFTDPKKAFSRVQKLVKIKQL